MLEKLILELNVRFCCSTLRGYPSLELSKCLLSSVRKKNKLLAEMYNANIEGLAHELPQDKRLLECTGETRGKSLLDFLVVIVSYKSAFYELHRLTKIAVTIPVTSAASERSFSALKLIKDYLRNTMGDNRLGDLGIIHNERMKSNNIDLDEFVDSICKSSQQQKNFSHIMMIIQ